MTLQHPIRPFEESDEELRRIVEDAHLPSLLVALAHATGDASLLREELRPATGLLAGPQGGYDEAKIEQARSLCLEALARYRDAGCPAPPRPGDEQLRR